MGDRKVLVAALAVLLVVSLACGARGEESWSWKKGFKREELGNGMVVRVLEDKTTPLVCLLVGIRGGVGTEPENKAGLTSLLSEAVFQGTKNFKGSEIVDLVERNGIELRGYPTYDGFYIRVRCLKDNLPLAMNIVSDAVLYPELGALQVRNAKMVTRVELMRSVTQPAPLSVNLLLRSLYPEHRFALPLQGEPERSRYVSPEDMKEYYKLNFHPERTVLAVAGDFDTRELMQIVREKFDAWRVKDPAASLLQLPEPEMNRYLVTVGGGNRVYMSVGTRVAGWTSEEIIPLEALVYVLGGDHPNAKLHVRLVEEELVASLARMRLSRRRHEAPLYFSVTTTRQTVYGVMAGVFEEIEKIRNGELAEQDLQAAKDFLKGELVAREASLSGKADLVVQQEVYGLPVDYWERYPERVDALTVGDLVEAARRYLEPSKMSGGIVTGYPDVVMIQLDEFGEVEEVTP
jgi:zinc protease